MSATNSNESSAMVKFEIPWKITWEQFDDITTKELTKHFITVRENVAFRWQAELTAALFEDRKIIFGICYNDGPLEKFNVGYELWAKKSDGSYKNLISMRNGNFNRSVMTCIDSKFGLVQFRENYSMNAGGPIYFLITLKIPVSVFQQVAADFFNDQGTMGPSNANPYRNWFVDRYDSIHDPSRAQYSDITLISRDGSEFYCHRLVLGTQSEAFEAMFQNASTDDEKKGIFRLPKISSQILLAAVEYFYTFDVQFIWVSFSDVMELTDFAEQYRLQGLKRKCIRQLWKDVLDHPTECVNLIRFADLRNMKYLKDRCFEVLVENFEELSLQLRDIFKSIKKRKRGGEDQDQNGSKDQNDRLRVEFDLYRNQRVEGTFL